MKNSERKKLARMISKMSKAERNTLEREHPELYRSCDLLGLRGDERWYEEKTSMLICTISPY